MNKIIYVGFAFMHHKGTCAGYHRIADYLKYDKHIDCQSEFEWPQKRHSWLVTKLINLMYKLHYPFNMWVSVRCILYNLLHSNCTFHFIYGENTYRWLNFFLRKSNRIVCTFHQPYSWFENELWQKRLRQLDGVILMSEDEISKFKRAAPQAQVKFIPHGIDVNFYKDKKISRKNQVLMVGSWLRDFNFANNVFQNLLRENKYIEGVVVTSEKNYSYFESHERLSFLSDISNENLCDLYNESLCLFLPLKAFTANNAVLEAAATNCPILIASDNVKNSYLDNDYIKLVPLKEKEVMKAILDMRNTTKPTRNYVVEHFSWDVISQQTLSFLNSLSQK